jgi:hypothetical protein
MPLWLQPTSQMSLVISDEVHYSRVSPRHRQECGWQEQDFRKLALLPVKVLAEVIILLEASTNYFDSLDVTNRHSSGFCVPGSRQVRAKRAWNVPVYQILQKKVLLFTVAHRQLHRLCFACVDISKNSTGFAEELRLQNHSPVVENARTKTTSSNGL